MPLTVLGIGYSLAPVGPDAVGGAEQILSALDRALVEAGHHSIVVGPLGSQVAGTLVPAGAGPDRHHRRRARSGRPAAPASRRAGIAAISGRCGPQPRPRFRRHLPEADVPTLVTLHLPRDFYPPGAVPAARPGTWFNCVR